IQIECTNEMSRFIADKGASMMGWNEILGKNLHADDKIAFSNPSQKIAPNVIVHFWKGDPKDMAAAAKDGYRIVNSFHEKTYLDYDYNQISLKDAYSYNPVPNGLAKEFEKNIIGAGCQMWSEWLPTAERMHEQTFPRIAAYAETGWTKPENKDYDSFLKRIISLSESWVKRGINVKTSEIK
ncbi:MAG: family 20 glycosylhydrolase, partial [Bacteroidales bacterium]